MKLELSDDEVKYLIKSLIFSYAESEEDLGKENIKQDLIDKLIFSSKVGYKEFTNIKKFNFKSTLKNKLFLGAGFHSIIDCNNLHKRLDYAISELCGNQQNGGMGSEFSVEDDLEARNSIKQVIEDIILAFDMEKEFNESKVQDR